MLNMTNFRNILCLGVGVLVALAVPCSAQYGPSDPGYQSPTTPITPSNPSGIQPQVPSAPNAPPVTTRPSTWPGSGETPPAAGSLPPGELKPCDGTRIVARVGSEVILESELVMRSPEFEVIGGVDHLLDLNKIPPEARDVEREKLIKALVQSVVETKLICLDAKHTIPSEGWPQIEKQLAKAFEDSQLERLMKQFKVSCNRELEPKLREVGTSIEREKRAFIDYQLSHSWVGQQIKRDDEITYDQMVVYYRQHQDQFTKPAQARWEELTVRFSKYADKAAAYDAIARLGNQVFSGAPFAEVARAGSDGVEAANGGQRDWTPKGGLACAELDRALFGLPIGQLGPIIEGPLGFHIIRVTEREEAAVTPFLDAQVAIRDKIVKERSRKQVQDYLAQLKAKTPIKTIADPDFEPQIAGRPGELRR